MANGTEPYNNFNGYKPYGSDSGGAYGRQGYPPARKKTGCLPVLLLIALVAVFFAWRLGYIDRWLYEAELERAGDVAVEVSTAAGWAEVGGSLASESASQAFDRAADQAAGGTTPYVYAQLNEDDQRKYRIVLAALAKREEQPYPTDSMDDLNRIYQCVQADHPELFYVNGISMETVTNRSSGMVERVSVKGRFAYTEETAALVDEQVEAAAMKCLAGIPADADDYGKAKYLYEWLAANVAYDHAAAAVVGNASADNGNNGDEEYRPSQTLEGALLQGSAVCGGYASAFQFLMQKLGLQAVFVTGSGNGGPHAWCLTRLDGEYYYVDPTWADPQSDGGEGELGYTNYDYLNVTTADLERTHGIESKFSLPECTAIADNYYVKEGRLLDWADEERLGALAAESYETNAQLQVRCADESVYRQLVDEFVSSGRIGRFIPGGSYRYSVSDANLSITLLP